MNKVVHVDTPDEFVAFCEIMQKRIDYVFSVGSGDWQAMPQVTITIADTDYRIDTNADLLDYMLAWCENESKR